MPKLQQFKDRFNLTIPNQYVKLTGWKKGDELIVYPQGKDELVVKRI